MIERRKPLKRTPLKRTRKAIARVGRKAKREQPARDEFRRVLRTRHGGVCDAIVCAADWRTICGTSHTHVGHHPHHVWPEDHDRGLHDPARGLWLCWQAHRWVHDNPAAAAERRLLRPHPPAVDSPT